MSLYARFEYHSGHLFRFDTRVYFNKVTNIDDSVCVANVVGKNPGSATAHKDNIGVLAELDTNGDRMLGYVRNRFQNAYKITGKELPENAYVRILNLFYLCNPDLGNACKTAKIFANKMPFDKKMR